jgi:hypothetical protein
MAKKDELKFRRSNSSRIAENRLAIRRTLYQKALFFLF